jgi:uncharacterized protein (DUF885 family)
MKSVRVALLLTASSIVLFCAGASTVGAAPDQAQALQALAHRYYDFAQNANPVGETDSGLHTADGKLADFSPAAQARYARQLRAFRNELASLGPGGVSVHDRVDYLLVRSDMEGDWWGRTYLKPLERDPSAYESECSNGIFSLLKKQFATNTVRAADATARLLACPTVLKQGEANLTDAVREFGVVASQDIAQGDALYTTSLQSLTTGISASERERLYAARDKALAALHDYKRWVDANLPRWHSGGFAVGKEQYDWMLRRVLLLPYTSDDLLQLGRIELARDRALDAWERDRQTYAPGPSKPQPPFTDKAAFLRYYEDQTALLRSFVTTHHIVTIPSYVGHFRIVELPSALAAINPGGFMNPPGVYDKDPTGFYFVPNYDPKNTSFFAAQARQSVLPVLAHEGIPGHFLQLSIAKHNADYIRRMHRDGVFVEGWAFYGEEMLMRTGLYVSDPAARLQVIHLMRHRATRVLVDVNLASGTMTLPQAVAFFARTAGIDHDTAYGEGTRFAEGPGQAIDYLTGKTQIEALIGQARDTMGSSYSLQAFHDRLLSYGSIPLSCIAWEWFGDSTWINKAEQPIAPVEM